MTKKCVIVTYQNAYNYGAVLQCFALQESLKKIGKEVKVLNYKNKNISNFYNVFYIPKNGSVFGKFIKPFLYGLVYFSQLHRRNISFKKFIKHNIELTKSYSSNQISKLNYGIDTTLIAGSDQIWNTDLTFGYDGVYFLNFSNDSKKISYAASIGKENLDNKYKNQIKKSLEDFKHITIREETGKKCLSKIVDSNIDVVLDPTLLLKRDEWNKYLKNVKPIKRVSTIEWGKKKR